MAYSRTTIVSAFVAMFLFALFYFDLIKRIPGFYCEGFSCLGQGILLMVSPIVVAAIFFSVGMLFVKQNRLRSAFTMACISLVFALSAVITTIVLRKVEVNRAVAIACREDPAIYCPQTLAR